MKLIKSKNADINYLAQIVDIKDFTNHPNPEVTKMKIAHCKGFNIIVGIDEQPGLFIYFPVLSQLNPEMLSYLNLYNDKEKNKDPKHSGFFSNKGIVKTIKLKGFNSEGFLLPFNSFQNFLVASVNKEIETPKDNTEFDSVEDCGKEFWISHKYIASTNQSKYKEQYKYKQKKLKRFDKLIENQFRFHYDTVVLRKQPNVIQPNDIIHISSKWHGTSGIVAYVLCHKQLNWKQKIANKLTGESFDKYDYIYTSRSVIKNRYINKSVSSGFYKEDLWTIAGEQLKPYLQKGMTMYFEIVGFTPEGKYIQKNYDYGCTAPKDGKYILGENYKLYIYRVTLTNIDGQVHEFSAHEVQIYCKNNGLLPVNELYYGRAIDLFPNTPYDPNINWSEQFMDRMANNKGFYMEELSPDCVNKVPHAGIVIKKEDGESHAWKLKCFKFLNKEQQALENGETNIEDNQ